MQHEEMEMKLWEYIDGVTTDDERERIAGLIETDELWKATYCEMLSFHRDIKAAEPLQTSVDFTGNVMKQILVSNNQYSARKNVFSYAIRAICTFFVAVVVLSIIYLARNVSWDSGYDNSGTTGTFKFPGLTWPTWQLPGNAGIIAAFVTVLVALLVIDKLFRRSLVR